MAKQGEKEVSLDLLIGKVPDPAAKYASILELLAYGNLKVSEIHLSHLQYTKEEDSLLSISPSEQETGQVCAEPQSKLSPTPVSRLGGWWPGGLRQAEFYDSSYPWVMRFEFPTSDHFNCVPR